MTRWSEVCTQEAEALRASRMDGVDLVRLVDRLYERADNDRRWDYADGLRAAANSIVAAAHPSEGDG